MLTFLNLTMRDTGEECLVNASTIAKVFEATDGGSEITFEFSSDVIVRESVSEIKAGILEFSK